MNGAFKSSIWNYVPWSPQLFRCWSPMIFFWPIWFIRLILWIHSRSFVHSFVCSEFSGKPSRVFLMIFYHGGDITPKTAWKRKNSGKSQKTAWKPIQGTCNTIKPILITILNSFVDYWENETPHGLNPTPFWFLIASVFKIFVEFDKKSRWSP